jgi:hypothetical protein
MHVRKGLQRVNEDPVINGVLLLFGAPFRQLLDGFRAGYEAPAREHIPAAGAMRLAVFHLAVDTAVGYRVAAAARLQEAVSRTGCHSACPAMVGICLSRPLVVPVAMVGNRPVPQLLQYHAANSS